MNRQKVRDAALLLPFFGLLLFLPPFVGLLRGTATVVGVPAIVLQVFLVWAALIGAGAWLSRQLQAEDEGAPTLPHIDGNGDADG